MVNKPSTERLNNLNFFIRSTEIRQYAYARFSPTSFTITVIWSANKTD